MIDILTQTEPFYHYTMIVEEGESYTTYAKTVDPTTEPIIVQANGKLTMKTSANETDERYGRSRKYAEDVRSFIASTAKQNEVN